MTRMAWLRWRLRVAVARHREAHLAFLAIFDPTVTRRAQLALRRRTFLELQEPWRR
jgi:hypothetical protein